MLRNCLSLRYNQEKWHYVDNQGTEVEIFDEQIMLQNVPKYLVVFSSRFSFALVNSHKLC